MKRSAFVQMITGVALFCLVIVGVFVRNASQPATPSILEPATEEEGFPAPDGSLLYREITVRRNATPQEMVHEIEKRYFLQNALILGHPRPYRGFMTIGIPTMRRPEKQNYLWNCLDSLLVNTNATEKNETVIVIFLSDFDKEVRRSLANQILERHRPELDSGLIQVIEAPREFYPTMENLKITYDHPVEQVKWRSKQNIDYAFMMKYSSNISQYYLQLEDDVTTIPNFMEQIKIYMSSWKTWACLEFSMLGFIGKLFHSSDLYQLANLLTLFYNEQPNDVTFLYFSKLMTQVRRHIIKPTLFQHHGFRSTLEGKTSMFKDKFFVELNALPNLTKTSDKGKANGQ